MLNLNLGRRGELHGLVPQLQQTSRHENSLLGRLVKRRIAQTLNRSHANGLRSKFRCSDQAQGIHTYGLKVLEKGSQLLGGAKADT